VSNSRRAAVRTRRCKKLAGFFHFACYRAALVQRFEVGADLPSRSIAAAHTRPGALNLVVLLLPEPAGAGRIFGMGVSELVSDEGGGIVDAAELAARAFDRRRLLSCSLPLDHMSA